MTANNTTQTTKDDFIIDTFNDDDTILVPATDRFHLSAAREAVEESASFLSQVSLTTGGFKGGTVTNSSPAIDGQGKLLYLIDDDLLAQFKANPGGQRRIIISEPAYDNATLWRIHDIFRSDGAVLRNIETLVEFTVGRKRSTVILDTNDYYDSDEDENSALKDIQSNDLYRKYIRGISKINKNLEMNEFEKMILTQGLVYGKAAILIEYDDDPILNPSAMPVALKPLSSLRIGRVFYYEDTWELAGIEYLDFKDVIVEPHRLIYFVNKDYHISPRTLWHGYSALESVIDIAETNILNNQTNIKEINRRLWADFLILKYMGKKKSDIQKFKDKWKPGMPIISNRDFEAQVIQIKSALNELIEQQNQADRKIARNLNIPQLLAGFDDLQSRAAAGGVLNAWMSSVVETRRTQLRNIFEAQWINPLLKRLIILNGDTMENLKNAVNTPPPQQQQLGQPSTTTTTTAGLPVPPSSSSITGVGVGGKIEDIIITNLKLDNPDEIIVNDLPFKVKMQFASFSISTIVDLASVVIGLKNANIIDWKLALTELDRKEYIPIMEIVQQEQMKLQQQQLDLQQKQLEQQTDPTTTTNNNPNMMNNNTTQNNAPRGPDASKVIQSATNLTKRTSKGSTIGSNNHMSVK